MIYMIQQNDTLMM